MKKILFTIIILLFSKFSFGQYTAYTYDKLNMNYAFTKDTLLIDMYLKKAKETPISNSHVFNYYIGKATKLSYKTKSIEQISKVYYNQGVYYQNNYKITNAIKLFNKALPLFERLNDTERLSLIYYKLGQSYSNTYSTENAFKFLTKSLELFKKNKNIIEEANCYNEIGNLYYNKNHEIALEYFKKALTIFYKKGDHKGLAITYINLANALADNGDYKQGIQFYYKSLALLKKDNDTYTSAIIYNNLGDSYKVLKQYDKALGVLEKSLSISKKFDYNDLYTIIYNNISDIKYKQGLDDEAILYANKSIEYSKEMIDLEAQNTNILILSNVYENKKQLDKAIKYKNKYIEIKEIENKYNDSKNLLLYKNISEIEKSQFQINKLKVENENNHLKLQSKRNINFLLLIVALILIISIIILILQQKEKRKVYNLLLVKKEQVSLMNDKIQSQNNYLNNLNNTKNKLLKIIAHDLKNPLSSIKGFADLMIQNYDDFNKEEKHTFLNAINESASKASEILDDLLIWAIENEQNLAKKNISIYNMINEELKLLEILALEKQIKIENLIDTEITINTEENKLGTVLRNLISNAIKFTPIDGNISIYSEKVADFIKITIKDTGVGMSEQDLKKIFDTESNKSKPGTNNEKGSGLGLLLCKDFIEILGGEISVVSELNNGSAFSITVPNN